MKSLRIMIRGMAVCALLCIGSGCATGRGTIDLAGIHARGGRSQPVASAPRVAISVVDRRVFQESPSDPAMPSIGKDMMGENLADLRACLIARKRNAYGMALGDIVTKNGYTVAEYIRRLVGESFAKAGYEVAEEGQVADGDIPVQVEIKQFWGWMTPGFWAITVSVRSEMDIVMCRKNGEGRLHQLIESSRNGMAATTGLWMDAFSGNADELVDDLARRIKAMPSP